MNDGVTIDVRELKYSTLWVTLGALLVCATLLVCLLPHIPTINLPGGDKSEHFIAYLTLTSWFAALVQRRLYGFVIAAMIALGGGIEIAQGLMHLGREASWGDMAANCTGMAAATLLALASRESWLVRIERWIAPR
jgi:VanZ family protein